MKRALITGITGQDGSYLAELLLDKGYDVHAIVRRASTTNYWRIEHLLDRIHLHPGDLLDQLSLIKVIAEVRPRELYNLAAMSFVPASWDQPMLTGEFNAQGVTRVLEAVRQVDKSIRIYQASSSEMFGKVRDIPQTELTPFYPRSPYAVAKLYAYWITVNYREAYGMHASNGILFNHESPIRGETFVTRKITRAVAAIERGWQERLYLGNLDAKRDWGHARDYVEGMWMMMQQPKPDDYVLATGEAHTVREFIERSFAVIGRRIRWRGEGTNEIGIDEASGKELVKVDPRYFRPTEVDVLLGDASKARSKLGWKHKISFDELVEELVTSDLNAARGARDRR